MLDIIAMRHGRKGQGNDPELTERGTEQVAEAAEKYLARLNFDYLYHGDRRRHIESAEIAKKVLAIPIDRIFKTGLLSIESVQGYGDIERCVAESLRHPNGVDAGFNVKNWNKLNPVMMLNMRKQFLEFCNEELICNHVTEGTILAISSSPLVEALHEDGFLVGEAGIIRYQGGADRVIRPVEVIFEGFFEN
ncbi:MAG: hypothetical protein ACD_15C00037G0028 [uncultured bacterium]|nr:MAG: hypothetical protein ACD_15C00037G0028 [uncultured bacterium]